MAIFEVFQRPQERERDEAREGGQGSAKIMKMTAKHVGSGNVSSRTDAHKNLDGGIILNVLRLPKKRNVKKAT